MSLKYLGNTLDIHGGGQDLVFPHHENEIAQSESFTGIKPFVKYWLHNGLVQLGAEKMSKSLGNLVTIKETLAKHSADALRLFILSSHYRSPVTYSEEALEAAEKGADRLRQVAQSEARGEKTDEQVAPDLIGGKSYRSRFIEAMDDDFNTAQALATLFDLAREINRLSDEGYSITRGQIVLIELAGILGLTLKLPQKLSPDAEPLIDLLISTRKQLREARQFQLADEIRVKLSELDIILEDTPQGTAWKHKR